MQFLIILVFQILKDGFMLNQHSLSVTSPKVYYQTPLAEKKNNT